MNQRSFAPVFSSSLRQLPLPPLVAPVAMDAALVRLMQPVQRRSSAPLAQEGGADPSWLWQDDASNALAALDVFEHVLPDGFDFPQFHALLNSAH
jgi:hypothetical protein